MLRPDLVKVLTGRSASAVEWLQEKFKLDLSLVSRLGGHSFPRTHRGKEKMPGMTITYALMETIEDLSISQPDRVKLIKKARVTNLIKENGAVVGVEYEYLNQPGSKVKAWGPVVLATGGYAADFSSDSLLKQVPIFFPLMLFRVVVCSSFHFVLLALCASLGVFSRQSINRDN